jgi:DNA primase
MRERLRAFFRPAGIAAGGPAGPQRGRFQRGEGRGGYGRPGAVERYTASDRLTRSAVVRGVAELPALRESVLALTVVNHPELIFEEFDEIAAIEFENRELMRLWTAVLGVSGDGSRLNRERMLEHLEAAGFAALVAALDRQIRNARIWIATEEAAREDAREAYFQALSLHKLTRALKWQRHEVERDIAEATEAGDAEEVAVLMTRLQQVQNEMARLEHQQALIDGFGVLSGRAKGPVRA